MTNPKTGLGIEDRQSDQVTNGYDIWLTQSNMVLIITISWLAQSNIVLVITILGYHSPTRFRL
jgi:hypothetical protein